MNKLIWLTLMMIISSCSISKSLMIVDGKDITSRYNIRAYQYEHPKTDTSNYNILNKPK